MKKRGFTLVELLAVIVILGVLAAIITPVVTGVLSKSEEYAYDKQVDSLIKAAQRWNLEKEGNLEQSYLCIAKESVTNGNLAYGKYNYGDEYSCELGDGKVKTFYVLQNNDKTVSLIMNMNVDSNGKGTTNGNIAAWCNDATLCKTNGNWDNTKGPITANNFLQTSTTSWTKLSSNQISLPTAAQIATASGTTFNDSYISGLSSWLKENLNSNKVPYGYWTSTPLASNSDRAWFVFYDGNFGGSSVDGNSFYGVRPVITIQKSQIKNLEALCTAKTTVTNGNLATGAYNYGDEYICNVGDGEAKTFYVLENGDTTTLTNTGVAQTGEVSLIMNKNIGSNGKETTNGSTVAWCKSGTNNSCAADGAKEYLKASTTSWTKLDSNQISLPGAYQILQAIGKTYDGDAISDLPTWLSGNLNSSSRPYGYWTSTPVPSYSIAASFVKYNGILDGESVTNTNYGIRPIITISKKQLETKADSFYLSLETLINDGIIENSEIINPKTNENMDGCISITYSKEYNQYEYKYISDNNLCN